MTRTEAREMMMKICFQMESSKEFNIDTADKYFEGRNMEKQNDYCRELYSVLCNKKEEIDQAIQNSSKGWKIPRMPKTDLAVMRVAAGEILFISEIPDAVSVNEAVELSKKYGTDDSGVFINGILRKLIISKEEQC